MTFLELDVVNRMPVFDKGKIYTDHYTDDEIVAISKLIRHLAQQDTLDLISSYLV